MPPKKSAWHIPSDSFPAVNLSIVWQTAILGGAEKIHTIQCQVTADSIALWLPMQSAVDLGEKRPRNIDAISRLFEPEAAVGAKGCYSAVT